MGNKIDLLNENRVREVSIDEAKEFAQVENFDYIETSALSGLSVEILFRRLVLSVAKVLPEVKNHLDLVGLPEGWMIVLPPPEPSSPTSNPPSVASTPANMSYLDAVVKKPRQISDDCGTSMETTSDGLNSFTPRVMKTHSGSSLENYKRTLSTDTVKSTPRVCYLNYWTGEVRDDLPDVEAPTGLLYIAQKKKKKKKEIESAATSRDTATRDTMDTMFDSKEITRESEIDPSLRCSME